MAKVWQEFHCRHCPADEPGSKDPAKGATGGYFRVKLETGYDAYVTVRCPKCGHEHGRAVEGGRILDVGAKGGKRNDEKIVIRVGLAAWSRTPLSAVMAKGAAKGDSFSKDMRNGAVIGAKKGDLVDDWRERMYATQPFELGGEDEP